LSAGIDSGQFFVINFEGNFFLLFVSYGESAVFDILFLHDNLYYIAPTAIYGIKTFPGGNKP
jgi:hypothetical protein